MEGRPGRTDSSLQCSSEKILMGGHSLAQQGCLLQFYGGQGQSWPQNLCTHRHWLATAQEAHGLSMTVVHPKWQLEARAEWHLSMAATVSQHSWVQVCSYQVENSRNKSVGAVSFSEKQGEIWGCPDPS